MENLSRRLARLSPAQRALFERELKKRNLELPGRPAPEEAPPAARPILPRPPAEHYPLSVDQERIFFIHNLNPEHGFYNIYEASRFQGELDLAVLERSLNEIVRRHEVLRTVFVNVDGRPVQIVRPRLRMPLELVDFRGLAPADREPAARVVSTRAIQRPFALHRLPLLRAPLLRLDDRDHICPIVFHHLIIDWVSFYAFHKELALIYAAFAQGRPSPLPELPVQYADYAVWQRRLAEDGLWEEQLAYWRDKLAGAPWITELPADRPRPPVATGHGGRWFFELPREDSDAIRALARKHGASLFMVLLAVFKAVIARFTGRPRVVVGSPVATYNQGELAGLIGFFLNQIVFYTDLAGDPGFGEVVRRVRETTLGAYAHKDLPFGRLVEALAPPRDLSRMPLAQIVFLFLNPQHFHNPRIPGLEIHSYPSDAKNAKFDLNLALWDKEEGFDGFMEYAADLFDATTIRRLARSLATLLAGAVADPEESLSRLPLLAPEERHQLLREWGEGEPLEGAGPGLGEGVETVPRAVAAQAAERPEAVAVRGGSEHWGEHLSYRALIARAEALARVLRRREVGRETVVALAGGRRPEVAVATLAVWRAGGAFLPLDPALPSRRLALLVADAAPALAVIWGEDGAAGDGVPALPPELPVLPLAEVAAGGAGPETSDDVAPEPAPGDLAYLIYTSGSTGRPKGVMVEHGSLARSLAACRRRLGLAPGDLLPAVAPFSFDVSLFELWGPLGAGATVEILTRRQILSPDDLARRLAGATLFHAVPSLMRQVVALARRRGQVYRRLRRVLVGGERVPGSLLAQMPAVFPGARLEVLYGPTEATIFCAGLPVPRKVPGDEEVDTGPLEMGRTLLGRPFAGTVLRLLDATGRPVPTGVVGELWIAGAAVARGYRNRPRETAERFTAREGSRFYRSGDLARFRPDGILDFVGRRDDQVKVRGFRIEPGEVEAALAAHPAVEQAVVAVRGEAEEDRRLVAWAVVRGPGRGAGPEELRRFLASRLPEYMVPSVVVPLSELPLSPSGKVDRRALPAPEEVASGAGGDFVPPRTAVERTLAEIWCRVLGREQVGVRESFFAAGGDSILSIQLVFEAHRAGLPLAAGDVFQHQTIAELAAVVGATPRVEAEQGPVTGEVPLTPIQRWFLEDDPADPHHFNQALLLEVAEPPPPRRLAAALAHLVRHHDALRLRLEGGAGGWRQWIAPPGGPAPLVFADLGRLAPADRRRALEQGATRLQGSLDLARGPLLQAAWFDLESGDGGAGEAPRLLLVIHHLAVDGVSWRILLADLAQLWRSPSADLPPKSTSFKAWSQALSRRREEPGDKAVGFDPLPLDDPAPADTVAGQEVVSRELAPEETDLLLTRAGEPYRTRVEELLLAALARGVAAWSGCRRLAVDLEGHGRPDDQSGVDLTRTVGWLTTLAPVTLEAPAAGGPGEVLKRVKEQVRQGLARAAGGRPVRSRGQLLFNYLGRLDQALPAGAPFRPAAEGVGPTRSPRALRSHHLEVTASVFGGRLRLAFAYGGARWRRARVESLAEETVGRLRELLEHCLAPGAGGLTPSDFPLADVGQQTLDRLTASAGGELEDLYPLAPMQEGILFDALYAPGSGVYVQQLLFELTGPLDAGAFATAWRRLLERHTALRSGFFWRELERPLQGVWRRPPLPFIRLDLAGLAEAEAEGVMEDLLAADRRRGFDPGRPPLMRVVLARRGPERHLCLWTHHHLLLDGWSLPLILREVMALYRAAAAGRSPELPPPRPFRDYLAWLARQDRQAAAETWQRRLAGFAGPTPLGVGRRPGGGGPAWNRGTVSDQRRRWLPAADTAALAAFARRRRTTPATLVQAAWGLLLGRYSGAGEVLFGVTLSGRPADLPGAEEMVGLLINSLPLRLAVPREAPLSSWLESVQERGAELLAVQHTPLTAVQEAGGVPRGTPLFESLLVFENYPADPAEALAGDGDPGALTLRLANARALEMTSLPLTLQAYPGAALTLRVSYDGTRFDGPEMERLLAHLARLLAAMPRRPEARLEELPLLSAAETHQLLAEWGQGPPAPRRQGPLHGLVATAAERWPERVALAAPEEQVSHGELGRRVVALARELERRGVGPEVAVGLLLPRSPAMVTALLAVLEAGGFFVPLDPDAPPARRERQVADAGLGLLLTADDLPRAVGEPGSPERWQERWGERRPGWTPELAAYALFTSGSTGRPKAVVNPHRGIVNRVAWMLEALPLDAGSRVLHKTPLTFDVSLWELFWPLAAGARLVLAAPGGHRDAAYLVALMVREGITDAHFVPSMLRAFLDEPGAGELPALERVMASGEALTGDLVQGFFARSGARLYNLYGPTEAAVEVTVWPCRREDAGAPVPIGRPLPELRLQVLDRHLEPQPAGVPGQIALGGAALARGYHRRGGLTAAAFVPDPRGEGERLYLTGDQGRLRPDGACEFLGRLDLQLKLRGVRVEPGEVEAVLAAHPGVAAVVVLPWGEGLAAWVVPRPGEAPPAASALAALARRELPEALVPSLFRFRDALPRTGTGKVDRRRLAAALEDGEGAGAEAGAGAAPGGAPRNPLEEIVAGAWAQVLARERVGREESFFALGGHSLSATRVASRLRRLLGREVPLPWIFAAPTPAALAARLAATGAAEAEEPSPPLTAVPREGARGEGDLPLSFAQQRLWFLDQLEPEAPLYHIAAAFRLQGALEVGSLGRAVAGIVRRHEILRTTFAGAGGRPRQVIHPAAGPLARAFRRLPVVELSALPAREAEKLAWRLAGSEARRPFRLAVEAPLRVTLLRLAADEHRVLVTFHHVAADGWSMGLFVRELAELYAAGVAGRPPALSSLPVQYADYAVWQRSWLAGRALESQLAYWRRALQGAPAALELPTDRPRRPVADYAGGRRPLALGGELSRELGALARDRGVTPFMILLAAFSALLGRLSGQREVLVGSPVANRNREETEELIGFFVNTLVLRLDLRGDPGFDQLLERAREVTLGAYAHQDLPFEKLVEELQPRRDLARTPFFQTMLVFQDAPVEVPQLPGLDLTPLPAPAGPSHFELTLALDAGPGGLTGSLEYRRDLFDGTTVERLGRHLAALLAAALARPEWPLSALSLLTAGQRQQLLREWGSGPAAPAAPPVTRLLARQAAARPEAAAVVGGEDGEEVWTYGRLAAASRALARRLGRLGVGPEEVVALHLAPSPARVAALFAVLEAGGAYLPLDPAYPPAHRRGVLADSGARVALADGGREPFDAPGVRWLDLEPFDGEIPPGDGGEPGADSHPHPAQAAYLIYTSGSTGRPKGVVVSHGALANTIREAVAVYGLAAGDRVLQFATLAFDASVEEIFSTLGSGATLVLSRPGMLGSAAAFFQQVSEAALTVLHLPTAYWHELARSLPHGDGDPIGPREEEAGRPPRPAGLRLVTLGGEKAALEPLARWCRWLDREGGLINTYGPTEAAVVATRWRATDAEGLSEVPLGRPVAGSEALLLDRRGEPVPAGAPGEICLAGAGLARGYHRRPGATAAAFLPHPSPSRPGDRLYRTGDRGHRRPGGELEFLGRLDHQVKVRGFRVEPGEVETALSAHPEVAQAVVVARPELGGEVGLAAYAVPAAGARLTPGALSAWLAERLPAHMLPGAWKLMDALPLTAGGKVDRRALPEPERRRQEGGAVPARRTPEEELLAELWSDLLAVEEVGPEEDFFALGGHSLLATQLASRVREAFGVELPLKEVFAAPTLAAMALRLATLARRGEEVAEPPLVPVERAGGVPLSYAQERLWFLDRLVPENPFYNMASAFRLSGELVVAALGRSLSEVVCRHQALRTRFVAVGGEPRQEVVPPAPVPLPAVDLSGLSGDAREERLRRLAAVEARRPFDLARGSLLRATLVRLGGGEHALLLDVHHIASDGWSTGVLYDELAVLYQAFRQGAPSPLPELPVQYPDFALWQRRWLAQGALDRQLAYWRRQLSGLAASLDLPTDRPRPAVESFRGAVRTFHLPGELTGRLRRLGRGAGATLSMTLLAAFSALLGRLTGRPEVAVGIAVANRTRRQLEGLIGFFVNTLVLRTDLGGSPSFGTLLARVRETSLAAYAHQDLPFETLVAELHPERSLARNPLVQVMYGYQSFPGHRRGLGELAVEPLAEEGLDTGTSKFDLTLFLMERGDRLEGMLEYARDLFDDTTIGRWAGHLRVLLEGAVQEPDRTLDEVPLLTPSQRHQLVAEAAAGGAAYPREAGLAELVTAQCRRRGEAVAVVWEEEALSYGELGRRARRLALELRRRGVGREARVGLALPASPELVTAMLAVLAAGGAYVPLDPAHPRRRRQALAAEAGVGWLLAGDGAQEQEQELAGVERIAVTPPDGGDATVGPAEPLLPGAGSGDSLAYVLFTSGSTGQSKGVAVTQRAVSRLALGTDYLTLAPGDRVGQAANTAFDAVTFEIWAPLITGATVVGLPRLVALSPAELALEIRSRALTVLFLTTALFHRVAADRPGAFASLRCLLFGGEAVDPRRVRDVLAAGPPQRLLHVYGPTESTTFASWHPVAEVPAGAATVPIGRPLAHTTLHLLDRRLQPVPPGVPGELAIAGPGLARGYAGQGAATARVFVPDPFAHAGVAPAAGERLYLTGDRVRRRSDGALEFLDRLDDQVKVRGFRVEPGEIEAALAEHPAVRDSAVVVEEGPEGDRRLVAYVVADAAAAGPPADAPEKRGEEVGRWALVFDDLYRRQPAHPDPTFNIVGWESSYTGEPLPAGEMAEWLEDTVGRLRALAPRRVLEIGCGTGMLLFRLAPDCERYAGTDLSSQALAWVRSQLPGRSLPHVELLERPAHELTDLPPRSFDLVILSSVVQYFPGSEYLSRVLSAAVAAVADGGAVFLGDVRSLPLLPAFHASVELERAEADLPLEALALRVAARRLEEAELVLDPAFFSALAAAHPRIRRVEVHPKWGRAVNELTAFRYQVVLRVGPGEAPCRVVPWLDGRRSPAPLSELRRWLAGERPPVVGIRHLANARVTAAAAAVRLLAAGEGIATAGELRQRASAEAGGPGAVEPEELRELADELGYEVELGWAEPGEEGRFEALFRRRGDGAGEGPLASLLLPPRVPGPEGRPLANDPLAGRAGQVLAPELRRHLEARLPEPMTPAAFVLVPALPLTANGKVDRRALVAARLFRPAAGAPWKPLTTPTQERLAGIWSRLLGVERPGADDDFFSLGGHSLLAAQVVSRIAGEFAVQLPLRALFESPSLASVAARIDELAALSTGPGVDEPPSLVPVPRDGELPLSPAQERLWFLYRFAPASALYHESACFRLLGALDAGALSRALDRLVERHESLRTTFPERDGTGVQVIAPPAPFPLPVVDLSALPAPEEAARRIGAGVLGRPLDLARGPVARGLLARLAEGEHALLLAFHHVVFDAWSIRVFEEEVSALYREEAGGEPAALPPLPVQYADFAVWQRRRLQGAVLERHLAYWRRRLAGLPALELPTDRPRPPLPSGRGALATVRMEPDLAGRLRELGRRQEATPFMVLLAAFQAHLGRLSGQRDVVVGTPVAGRNREEVEGLIGFFVNMLVLRTDLSGGPTFRRLLARGRETALGALAHQELPFERLVEELSPPRDPSRHPLFQVTFQLLMASGRGLELPGVTLAPFTGAGRAVHLDLDLTVMAEGEGLTGYLEYATDLFDGTTAERLLAGYRRLLAAAVEEPDRPLAELSLLAAAERHQLLAEWNDRVDLSEGGDGAGLLPERFARRAGSAPEAVATGCGDAFLSYGELARHAGGLARRLAGRGIGPGELVAVALPRSAELPAALLGILQSGAAYLPLDLSHPPRRLEALLVDSGAGLVVTASNGLPAPLASPARELPPVLPFSDLGEAGGPLPATSPAEGPAPEPGWLAYVLYTSGSTGEPKGVEVTHGALAHLLAAAGGRLGGPGGRVGPGESLLAVTTLSFDIAALELFLPLTAGGRALLTEEGEAADPRRLGERLAASGASVMQATPATWRLLLEGGWPGDDRLIALCGGEALEAELARRLRSRVGELWNLYGPTEATVWATAGVVAQTTGAAGDGAAGPASLGRPLAGYRVYLLGHHLEPVPAGAPGELLLGGPGLARGYRRRPAQTAERFIPDPWAQRPGGRLYRTGDLARTLTDGRLVFLGRLDQQVKVQGFRIEPAEVEAALARHPAVAQAVVTAREDGAGGRRLVAYAVTAAGAQPVAAEELRAFAARRLPAYMVPAVTVWLAALPLTPAGKVDRRALPAPEGERRLAGAYTPPRNRAEERLVAIWREVLGVEEVGALDSFFDLGGHSLLATRVLSRVRRDFGLEVPVAEFFAAPTVAALAARLAAAETAAPGEGAAPTPPPIRRVSRHERRSRPSELDSRAEGEPGPPGEAPPRDPGSGPTGGGGPGGR